MANRSIYLNHPIPRYIGTDVIEERIRAWLEDLIEDITHYNRDTHPGLRWSMCDVAMSDYFGAIYLDLLEFVNADFKEFTNLRLRYASEYGDIMVDYRNSNET